MRQAPEGDAFDLYLYPPLLVAAFAREQTMLSWSLTRPGFVAARRVAWLQVRDAELGPGVDAAALLDQRMGEAGLADAVPMMTARDLSRYRLAAAVEKDVTATCLATVGLANAGRVGRRLPHPGAGTINLLLHVSRPLRPAALIELLAIAVEARTAAVLDLDRRVDGRAATGTGTDCVVVAAPVGEAGEAFAGQHTAVGTAAGRAVEDAVSRGGRDWIAERAGAVPAGPDAEAAAADAEPEGGAR